MDRASPKAPNSAKPSTTKPTKPRSKAGASSRPAAKKPATPKASSKPATKKPVAPKTKTPSKAKTKDTVGRQRAPGVEYSESVVLSVCAAIADGLSLRSACKLPGMPSTASFMRWLADESNAWLREQYARACEERAHVLADEIIEISDEQCTMVRADKHGTNDDDGEGNSEVVFDAVAVARNRLRVDSRKWLASKLAPKKYGDKVTNEHVGANGGAIQVASTVQFVEPPKRSDDE
jgi:hypothetical protein